MVKCVLSCRVFQNTVEKIDLRGQSAVDAEWMAYIGAFRYLCTLNVADCHKIGSAAIWPLAGMHFRHISDVVLIWSRCRVIRIGVLLCNKNSDQHCRSLKRNLLSFIVRYLTS